ncbi:hypothetical protein BGZ68_010280 [Mortierella alpina]|nr:hypothetical protein BGZ68_010280 [Mortierella alpina]
MNGIEANFIFAPQPHSGGAEVVIEVTEGLSKRFVLSPTGGYEYHIHENPVGPDDDCMATGGHLDPFKVGSVKCNASRPEKCQEGDLSGKHGELMATESGAIPTISYLDRQLQFSGAETTIAGRSVVIHNNGTRVACGDILSFTSDAYREATGVDDGDARVAQHTANGVEESRAEERMYRVVMSGVAAMALTLLQR